MSETIGADDLPTRFIQAAQSNGGVLGKDAIKSLMAEAWNEGLDAGLNGGWDNPYEETR